MKLKSKKGSALVEASLIFPVVIAGVMAVIYISISLYSSFSLQSSIHLFLKGESGRLSKTIYNEISVKDHSYETDRLGFNKMITIEVNSEYGNSRFYDMKIKRVERGRAYIINEAELVRRINLAEEVLIE